MEAVARDGALTAKALLDYGASVTLRDKSGFSVGDYQIGPRCSELAGLKNGPKARRR